MVEACILAGNLKYRDNDLGCNPDENLALPTDSTWSYVFTMTPDDTNAADSTTSTTGTINLVNASMAVTIACPGNTVLQSPDRDGDGFFDLDVISGLCVEPIDQSREITDCNDSDPAVNPGASEVCDHQDNDCSGLVDEPFFQPFLLLDRDGDSYGDPNTAVCDEDLDSAVSVRGDCDDNNANVHPFAEDVAGDDDGGLDSDCGGTDGLDPSIQGPDDSSAQFQTAIDAATSGIDGPISTVWVGPGTYYENQIYVSGKTVQLRSTHGPEFTTINANVDGSSATLLYIGNLGDAAENDNTLHPTVDGFTLTGADASVNATQGYPPGGENGGAIFLQGSSATLSHLIIRNNRSATTCAGAFVYLAVLDLDHCLIVENDAQNAAGLCVTDSDLVMNYTTIANNSAQYGGGAGLILGYSVAGTATIDRSILAYNDGIDLYFTDDDDSATLKVTNSLLVNTGASHNLAELDTSNSEIDPDFVRLSNIEGLTNDYHLMNDSPVQNFGDSEVSGAPLDPDSSLAGIGAYAGPNAAFTYDNDRDQDGLPDGWESANTLDLSINDAEADSDSDGVNNLTEYRAHLDPQNRDCDGDLSLDGIELSADSDPLEWASQPGYEQGSFNIHVSNDFNTIQEAVDKINREAMIQISAGTYQESVTIEGKTVTLMGSDPTSLFIVDASGTGLPALVLTSSNVTLQNMRITGGNTTGGSGILSAASIATLSHVEISNNAAIFYQLIDGKEVGTDGIGGAISAAWSDFSIVNSRIVANTSCGDGAGMYFLDSRIDVQNSLIADNITSNDECYEPLSPGAGGGLVAWNTDQSAEVVLTVHNVIFSGNEASDGPALLVHNIAGILSHAIIVDNAYNDSLESTSNGIVKAEYSQLTVTQSIFTQNGGTSVYTGDGAQYLPTLEYYCFPDTTGCGFTDGSNLCADPQFLAYDDSGLPMDYHLALTDPANALIDGGDPSQMPDPDNTLPDIGIFGGPDADGWDFDGDDIPSWFWPGTISDAPSGFSSSNYDANDSDPSIP